MRRKSTGSDLHIPLTPMIDCTFLLIIFFLLAAQMAGEELPKLALHAPEEPATRALAEDVEQLNHVTVNIITPYGGSLADRDPARATKAKCYQVGVDIVPATRSDAMATLVELLASRKSQADIRGISDFWVEIRADKDVRYGDIEPVMQAASDAGISRMSLTAAVANGPQVQTAGDE